jgi:hypothetical protein
MPTPIRITTWPCSCAAWLTGGEMHRLAEIGTDILYDTGASVHALPYRDGFWRERTPLMHEVRRDGIDL